MPLQSNLFKGHPTLEACLTDHSAHVVLGVVGDHVSKIQRALFLIDGHVIDTAEVAAKQFGPTTAAAVLEFKQKRRIINFSYQTPADNIVGKMTIAALDREMLTVESSPSPPICDFSRSGPELMMEGIPSMIHALLHARALSPSPEEKAIPSILNALLHAVALSPTPEEKAVLDRAFQESRQTLQYAIISLNALQSSIAIAQSRRFLAPEQVRVLGCVARWLNVNPRDLRAVSAAIGQATILLTQNLNIRTSKGKIPPLLRRFGGKFHGLAYIGNPDLGVSFGDPFFTTDGPKCRRDVVTHEWFHLVGALHGGGRDLATGDVINPPRESVTTTPDALDSADHLAQLVSEIATAEFDSCLNGK